MGRRLRAHDWASTPLGALEHWPQSLRSVVDTLLGSPVPSLVAWGADHTILYNDAYLALFGALAPRVFAQPTAVALAEFWDRLAPRYARVRAGETIVLKNLAETYLRDETPETFYFTAYYSPLRDETGRVAGVLVQAIDTTEQVEAEAGRRRTEMTLREREARYRAIVEQATVGVSQTDLTGRFLYVNDRYCEIVGRSREELLGGLRLHDVTEPEDLPRNLRDFERLLGDDTPFAMEKRYRLPDGRRVWAGLEVSLVRDAEGEPLYVQAVVQDITERKRAEAALAASEARYRIVAETASDVLVTIDKANTILYLNPAVEKVFGYPPAELLGERLDLLMPEYLRHLHEAAIARYLETGRRHISWSAVEVPGLHRDGHEIDLEVSFGEHNEEGRHLFTAIIRDITERKRAEVALAALNRELEDKVRARTREVQELAGQLTLVEARAQARLAQVLHDELQQQLYAVQFALRGLRSTLGIDRADTLGADHGALQQLDEVKDLVGEAVAIARTTTANLSPPVLRHEGLVEALRWLGTDMAARHGLRVRVEAAPTFAVPREAVRVLLFQLVRELLFNVVKHAGVDEATVRLSETGGRLELSVADLGAGFDPRALDQAATGFGLLSVRRRLELFGGRFDLVAAPGQGTRATLILPATLLTLD
jgi:PAS domain S-box-containing protein